VSTGLAPLTFSRETNTTELSIPLKGSIGQSPLILVFFGGLPRDQVIYNISLSQQDREVQKYQSAELSIQYLEDLQEEEVVSGKIKWFIIEAP